MVTLSDKGIFWTDGRRHVHEEAHLRTVADVSGAGDTVIAVAACCMAAKIDPETMARLCNLAGGLVCESVGVVPLTHQRLWKEARRLHLY
jgi:bifunctional ADP-heptose synthase (sugar kinase/adenylyltransferase)